MKLRRRTYRDPEIEPDEIFLDVSNEPAFDRARFEGRIEKPLSRSTYTSLIVVVALLLSTLALRAAHLQLVQGSVFASQSKHNSLESTLLLSSRGLIVDRNNVVLVENYDKDDGSKGRNYLLPELGQIIGYVSRPKKDSSGNYYDTSMTGIAGIEAMYDIFLNGENGKVLVEKDALGKVRSSGVVVPPRDGETLRLSMDANVSRNLSEAISSVAKEKNFMAGAGVIMDVHTGEIIGIASYPSYDPNVMSRGGPAEIIQSYNTSPGHPFLDHAVQGIYAPGSVVKPFVAAGALTDGIVTPTTIIDDPGFISLDDPYTPGKVYRFTGWKPLGLMDVRKAIAWSSDIYFYTIAGGYKSQKGMGIDRLAYWYRQFGFGSATGIDLPSEAVGLVPTPEWKQRVLNEQWYLADTYFTAIGQYATQVTPIQVVRATAAVANGGTLYTPTLRHGLAPVGVPVAATPESLDVVRSGMRETVTIALAQRLNVPYLTVAGKTGTAQTGTRNQYDNSWIEGFFPYENPRYAFVVVLERGPEGSGAQSVHAMRKFLDLMHAEDSVYVGGTGIDDVAATQLP